MGDALRQVVESLEPRQAAVLKMRFDWGMDAREIQQRLKAAGIQPTTEADESGSGPAHFTLVDPDGNPILVDQHV